MVVKVYVSGISGNKEVKKRQQKVLLILDSKKINYEVLDIAEPNMEEAKEYMQNNSKMNGATISDPNPRHPLPPQLFNDEEYCGDYDAFDMANEIDEMEKFLKLAEDEIPTSNIGNGEVPSKTKSKESSPEKDSAIQENGKEEENEPKINAADEEKSKEKSPSPQKEKSRSASKEKSLEPEKEKSPSPQKAKSPSPQKEKSPSPQKEKSPSPAKDEEKEAGDNETDDQKAENASKDDEADTAKDTEETEKSDEE